MLIFLYINLRNSNTHALARTHIHTVFYKNAVMLNISAYMSIMFLCMNYVKELFHVMYRKYISSLAI